MPKIKSRPVPATDHDADLERWRVAGAKLREQHPQLFEQLLGLGRCAVREFEAGEDFEAHLTIKAFEAKLTATGGAS